MSCCSFYRLVVMDVCCCSVCLCFFFFFKQKTAYEMRISDWSSDVCSSDLPPRQIVIEHRDDEIGRRLLDPLPQPDMALPPHFGDPLAVGDLMVDIGADMGGEGGILDPEHQLEIEEQAAHVEIGRTDMDGVVDDVELGVELGRLIFVDLDSLDRKSTRL